MMLLGPVDDIIETLEDNQVILQVRGGGGKKSDRDKSE